MLQRPPKLLDQEQHKLVFAWERFSEIVKELPPLFKRHWREIALNQDAVLLDPSWDTYIKLDLMGVLRILTVRSHGALVGYHFLLVVPHLHYNSTLSAETDLVWLDPAFRFGLTGYRLLKQACDDLKAGGVKLHKINEKLHAPFLGPLLKRLGYAPIETAYCKVL